MMLMRQVFRAPAALCARSDVRYYSRGHRPQHRIRRLPRDTLRGLPIETREYIAAATVDPPITSSASIEVGKAQLAVGASHTMLDPHDPSAAFAGRIGSKMEQQQKRPLSVNVGAIEDARSIDPMSERCLALEERILAIVSSSVPLLERGHNLVDVVVPGIQDALMLRANTVEAIIGTWYSTLSALGKHGSTPIRDWPFYEHMLRLYHYGRGLHVEPSAAVIEQLMVTTATLTTALGPTERMLHVAVRLMQDSDRYCVLPSRTTFAAFFDVCGANDLMDVAIRRFADAQDNLYLPPDSPMCASILTGLTRNNQIGEAVAFMARIQSVPVDVRLLNASLEALVLSPDPSSVFAAYSAAVEEQAVLPDTTTFTLLLTACQRMDQWDKSRFVLGEMQRLRIRGDEATLNLLLKGLMLANLTDYARILFGAMRERKVTIWPAMQEAAKVIGIDGSAPGGPSLVTRNHTTVVAGRPHRTAKNEELIRSHAVKRTLDKVGTSDLKSFLAERGCAITTTRRDKLLDQVHKELYGVRPRRLPTVQRRVV
jgi:hypothetical protein